MLQDSYVKIIEKIDRKIDRLNEDECSSTGDQSQFVACIVKRK